LSIKENTIEMFLRTIYERIQMNLIVHYIENSAKRYAYAISNMHLPDASYAHNIGRLKPTTKTKRFVTAGVADEDPSLLKGPERQVYAFLQSFVGSGDVSIYIVKYS
jgi:hypothetical protein